MLPLPRRFFLVASITVASGCGDDGGGGVGGSGAAGSTAVASSTGATGSAGGGAVVDSSKSCGHAHNDFEHPNPLHDALDHGFCSVEADIFLIEGALLVAHDEADADPARSLVSLYLDPLRALARQGALRRGGAGIGPHGGPLQLLIDVKSAAEATYAVLDPLLASYSDVLTAFEDGVTHEEFVTAVVSGAPAQATMAVQPLRYAAIDGRIGDPKDPVAPGTPVSLVPLVSQDWVKLFLWSGAGEIPAEYRAQLGAYVDEAHGEGRLLRFWGTEDNAAVWTALAETEVDLINVDDLAGFESFKAEHDRAP